MRAFARYVVLSFLSSMYCCLPEVLSSRVAFLNRGLIQAPIEDAVLFGTIERPYNASTTNADKHGGVYSWSTHCLRVPGLNAPSLVYVTGKIKYESSECTLVKYSFGIYALDNSQGTALHPLVGDTVSFKLFASDV